MGRSGVRALKIHSCGQGCAPQNNAGPTSAYVFTEVPGDGNADKVDHRQCQTMTSLHCGIVFSEVMQG